MWTDSGLQKILVLCQITLLVYLLRCLEDTRFGIDTLTTPCADHVDSADCIVFACEKLTF